MALPGEISSRGPGTTGAQRQRDALALEGVEVHEGGGGKLRVNVREYGWFPEEVDADLDLDGGEEVGVAAGVGEGEGEGGGGEGGEEDSDSDLTSLESGPGEDHNGRH